MPRHSESTLAAIKNAVDIVALIGESLPLHRSGSKFKALCPFHDDHNPSLEINPERQSFKCWSCGAGGDVFDFVKDYERIEFPEALRMLAERAGVALDSPSAGPGPKGPSKSDLLAVNAWAEGQFAEALGRSPEVLDYVSGRGISAESVARFRLGYAPDARDWLTTRGRRQGYSVELLERAGLLSRPAENPGLTRERFRGRLIFPIHDLRGRPLGFGGRILPAAERALEAEGRKAAKYLNSPETAVFQKRRVLYASDLARAAAREAGWVAVVEGYTDVIAAHQVGLGNVVGTLGTAFGEEHVAALRRLADRVVLIFDGDEAGQTAADRALEIFLGHEIDVRVLTLPRDLDPCDFLLKEGAEAFRALVDQASDPLGFAIGRAGTRFDLDSPEDARRAADWVLGIVGRIPESHRHGLDLKVAKALDTLSRRLRVPVAALDRRLREIRRSAAKGARTPAAEAAPTPAGGPPAAEAPAAPIRPETLDPVEREVVEVALNEPGVVGRLISRVAPASIHDPSLRKILSAIYDLYGLGVVPTFDQVMLRLDDQATRALVAGLAAPSRPRRKSSELARHVSFRQFQAVALGCAAAELEGRLAALDPDEHRALWAQYRHYIGADLEDEDAPSPVEQTPWEDRFRALLARLDDRDRESRLNELKAAIDETDPTANPDVRQALWREYFRLFNQRPGTKTR